MKYLWQETVSMPKFKPLKGDSNTDVLIIGGGITGILCAYLLKQNGIDHILLEANTIGSGTSRGTTAVLTAQHSDVYTKITKKFGKDTAKGYLDANLRAIDKYRKLAEKFDFDFCDKDSYIYSLYDRKKLEVEATIVRELGFPAEYTENPGLPMENAGAVIFPGMAEFHPLKLITALSKHLNIYEHTHVKQIEENTAYFDGGSVKANKIIVATHFPFINRKGMYPVKLYQKRSFVLGLENAPKLKGNYADIADRGIYMRNYKDLLIVGGGDCRTATKNDGFNIVRQFVQNNFPNAHEKYAWAAQDCMSLDNIPYIGNYSKTFSDVYIASGFNEWGMSSSMVAALILNDMIMERDNQFARLFSPDRGLLSKQAAVNLAETVMNLLNPKLKRCSHLGCALRKNEAENTWDCPCHGSRFDIDGHLIDNPATRDL